MQYIIYMYFSRISCTHVASGHRSRINSHAIGLPIESFNDAMTDITLALESVYIYRHSNFTNNPSLARGEVTQSARTSFYSSNSPIKNRFR